MVHKKFMDIQRIKPEYADGFNVGNHIVIQEKLMVQTQPSDMMSRMIR